jgi:hypothetical protein
LVSDLPASLLSELPRRNLTKTWATRPPNGGAGEQGEGAVRSVSASPGEQEVLGELHEYLATTVIPRLPSDCEWKWVAIRLYLALGRVFAAPPVPPE